LQGYCMLCAATKIRQSDQLQAELDKAKAALKEIGLERDRVFPRMLHCKVCGARDIAIMGHGFGCKLEQALRKKESKK